MGHYTNIITAVDIMSCYFLWNIMCFCFLKKYASVSYSFNSFTKECFSVFFPYSMAG